MDADNVRPPVKLTPVRSTRHDSHASRVDLYLREGPSYHECRNPAHLAYAPPLADAPPSGRNLGAHRAQAGDSGHTLLAHDGGRAAEDARDAAQLRDRLCDD